MVRRQRGRRHKRDSANDDFFELRMLYVCMFVEKRRMYGEEEDWELKVSVGWTTSVGRSGSAQMNDDRDTSAVDG